jgi:hypothetical protein
MIVSSLLKDKLKASGVHLVICLIIGLIVLGLLWSVYYPSPLLEAIGGTEIFLMLLAIDVTLGPLLTFVVFKSGKKSLKFDLAIIGLVQLAALAFGLHTLWIGRPVYIAALGHKFDVVRAIDVPQKELDFAKVSLPVFSGPKWTGIKIPDDAKERDRVLMTGLGGVDYGHYPQHHASIASMLPKLLEGAQPISELKKANPGKQAAIDAWLRKHGASEQNARFLMLNAPAKTMAVVLDSTGKIYGIAPFQPY